MIANSNDKIIHLGRASPCHLTRSPHTNKINTASSDATATADADPFILRSWDLKIRDTHVKTVGIALLTIAFTSICMRSKIAADSICLWLAARADTRALEIDARSPQQHSYPTAITAST